MFLMNQLLFRAIFTALCIPLSISLGTHSWRASSRKVPPSPSEGHAPSASPGCRLKAASGPKVGEVPPLSAQAEPRPVRGGALVDGRDPRRARVPRLHSWLKVPSSLFEDPTRPARLVPSRAQAAPTHPRAPPEQLASLPWAQQPASGRPQVEDASTWIHQAPGRTTSTTPSARRSRWAASSSCSASQLVGGRALHTLFEDAAPSARLVTLTAQAAPTRPRAPPEHLGSLPWPQEPASGRPEVEDSPPSTTRRCVSSCSASATEGSSCSASSSGAAPRSTRRTPPPP